MKAMRMIAVLFVASVLLGGCSRDETPVNAPESTNQVPQAQPQNEPDRMDNRNIEDPVAPPNNNPYTPTEDPYAPSEGTPETMGEDDDGVSPPADEDAIQ